MCKMAIQRFVVLLTLMLHIFTAVAQSDSNSTCDIISAQDGDESHVVVNCSYRGLHRLPSRLPWQHVIGLDASHNSINNLTYNDLRYFTQLRWLNMSVNKLTHLDPDTFEGPGSSLTFLDLSINSFSGIPDASFIRLDRLESLLLSACTVPGDLGQGFRNLTRLKYLSLAAFKFKNFSTSFFSNFVPDMTSVPLEKLILDFSTIETIHNFTFSRFSRMTTLSVSNVELTTIEKQSFHGLSNLQTLILNTNYVKDFDNVFSNLSSLENLDLSSNHIELLAPGMFDDLHRLQSLELYPNPVTRIHNGAFASQGILTSLKLGGSGFLLLDPGAFEGLVKLEDLHMNGAGLANLSSRQLKPLKSLRHISLDRNVLDDIPSDTFHPVRGTLEILSMIGCMLTPAVLREGLLRDLPMLQHIFLDDNLRLDYFPSGSLKGLTGLLRLSVAHSNLSQFPAEVANVSTLKDLDVSYNVISSVRDDDVAFLSMLTHFRGAGNPYNCSCDLWGFMQWFGGARIIADDRTNYKCAWPRRLLNHNFTDFNGAAACSSGLQVPLKYVVIAASSGGGLLLVIALAASCWCGRWKFRRALFRRSLLPYQRLEEEEEQEQEQERQRPTEYRYSAFVLYSPKDYHFINRELIPNLERPDVESAPAFKLAVDFRDALPGNDVTENASMLMRSSRKVLLMVSGSFLRETWATNNDILVDLGRRRRNPFVVLCLEQVEDPAIPAILRQSVKITWPGAYASRGERDLFWWKVRGALDPLGFSTTSYMETSDSL